MATSTPTAPLNQRRIQEVADLFKTLNPHEQEAVELLVEKQRIENLKRELESKKQEIATAEDDLNSLWDQRNTIFQEIRIVEVREAFFYNRISTHARDLFLEHPLAESREDIPGHATITDAEVREFYQKLTVNVRISMEDAKRFFGFKNGAHLCRLYGFSRVTLPYQDRWAYDKSTQEFHLV